MATVAERICSLRKERNLSQTELGQLLGQTKSAISMWERGERSPNFRKMEQLADTFNVDLEYMYGRTDVRSASPILTPAPVHVAEVVSPMARKYGDLLAERPDIRRVVDVIKNLSEDDVFALLAFLKSYRVN